MMTTPNWLAVTERARGKKHWLVAWLLLMLLVLGAKKFWRVTPSCYQPPITN